VPAEPGNRIAELFNRVPKHVATHRGDALDWHNSHALEGELAGAVRALKPQGETDLLTFGSGEMVAQLLAAGLVDELQLLIFPVLLGRGIRLFGEDAQAASFELTRSIITAEGVLVTRYARAGEVRTATFGQTTSAPGALRSGRAPGTIQAREGTHAACLAASLHPRGNPMRLPIHLLSLLLAAALPAAAATPDPLGATVSGLDQAVFDALQPLRPGHLRPLFRP